LSSVKKHSVRNISSVRIYSEVARRNGRGQ
jgi:hypothetical protein